MKRIRVSKNFYLDEFIDPYTYFNEADNGLSLIDNRLFKVAQLMRDLYGQSIVINNWWRYYQSKKKIWNIDYIIIRIERSRYLRKWSGIRTGRCFIGAKYSAHRIIVRAKGLAIDLKGNQHKLYKILKDNAEAFYCLGVRRCEDISITKHWLHLDLLERNTKPNSIRVVNLTRSTRTIYF